MQKKDWSSLLAAEKSKEYFQKIISFIEHERKAGKIIYPKNSDIFSAFSLTDPESLKVVIIGQDPYHGPDQAHGLCFSVVDGVPQPPSLQNIFKEIENDLGIPRPKSGCLTAWAKQGVLLLNTVLSVEKGKAHSHAGIGWEIFTDHVIETLSTQFDGLIFLLWGSPAQKKASLINPAKHHILKSVHPSPLSAHRGFFGCQHFSKTNQILREQGKVEIDWRV